MTLQGIAYGPDEHVLLTLDGAELLAHDAQTEAPKWRLTLPRPLVAVLFADANALPGGGGASPWRTHSSGRSVVTLDAEGSLHAFDPALGQELGTLGPFGKPTAVAAGAGGLLAIAADDRLRLWRSGELTEIPGRASAIAFSNDGATLAIGGSDGSLRFLSVAAGTAPVETFCAVVHGGITDLVQHPGGMWIAGGKAGITTVTDAGPRRLDNVPAGVMRLGLDAGGKRLAVQLSDRAVAVYEWPSLEVATRIETLERLVRGVSFGPGDWLGLALDHGDGNKIDVRTSATHRTDTHPGRTHRSWMLSVRGKETVLSAEEAEDVRQMKEAFHVAAPAKGSGNNGARVGIGVAISFALLCLRLCAAGSRSSSYTPPYNPGSLGLPAEPTACDQACAARRLELLRRECTSNAACDAQARDALTAFAAGDCKRAKASLARTGPWHYDSRDVPGRAALSLARRGLDDACASGVKGWHTARHATLVRLTGPTLEATTEEIPAANLDEGEEPGAMWTATDGTAFVSTVNEDHTRSNVHRRDRTGEWDVIARRRSTEPVQIWGRSATDLYIMDGDSLASFDGIKTTEITPPAPTLRAIGGFGGDLIVAGESYHGGDANVAPSLHLHRRRGPHGAWATEPATDGLVAEQLWSGGGALWGRAAAPDGIDDRLVQRSANGRWTERKWFGGARPSSASIRALWVSPSGEAFVATETGVFRSANSGTSWSKTGAPPGVEGLWGRSSADVYATTASGVQHYDGKAWTATSYTERATVIGGTATDVLLMGTTD